MTITISNKDCVQQIDLRKFQKVWEIIGAFEEERQNGNKIPIIGITVYPVQPL